MAADLEGGRPAMAGGELRPVVSCARNPRLARGPRAGLVAPNETTNCNHVAPEGMKPMGC